MEQENFDSYLALRYQTQIRWYDQKAKRYKWFYNIFQWIIILTSAVVPVLISVLPTEKNALVIILSVILSIATTATKAFKLQENWINYRTITESLKKEQYYYEAKIDCYSDQIDHQALFIERVESLISRENSLWIFTHMENNDKKDKQNK